MSLIFHVIEFFSITKQSALSGSLLTLNSFSHSRLECRRNLSFFFFCFFFFQKAISHPAFPLFLQKQIMYFIVIPACCYTSSCSLNSAATVPAALIYKQCAAKKQQKAFGKQSIGFMPVWVNSPHRETKPGNLGDNEHGTIKSANLKSITTKHSTVHIQNLAACSCLSLFHAKPL